MAGRAVRTVSEFSPSIRGSLLGQSGLGGRPVLSPAGMQIARVMLIVMYIFYYGVL